ncbi:unnamed protein product [Rotaria socialis]|uniref:Uncharacterized protein n=1 Tax=Rotaria socialis TaxID=392032 RepID=A0A818CZK9_9BILA|nr:unnamed protein product [Rotaria socialis]
MNDIFSFFDELRSSPRLDFDDSSLTNEDYEAWPGWSEEQFNDMFKEISVYLRSSSNRTSLNALAIFWIKIKTNLSFRQIGSLFNISGNSDTRRLRAADAFDSVRELFIKYFVSKHLGIGHITIDDAKIHNTAYSKVRLYMFGDNRRRKLNTHECVYKDCCSIATILTETVYCLMIDSIESNSTRFRVFLSD